MDDPVSWRYRRVQLTGVYDASHQILLDNQVYGDQAGYHVPTPLLIDGNRLVLVNRGWVAGSADHQLQPRAEVPEGTQTITGRVWLPPSKFYSLETAAPVIGQQSWPVVWQNLDMARYAAAVNQPLTPVVIRLDPQMPGGYVRDWPRPAERIGTHIGYAYQWFGFAVATLFIYLFVSFRKKPD
jgi:surfeit locus 1 family protein